MVFNIFFSFFFFFKQKTAYEITRRDWSSDVCSSDLANVIEEIVRVNGESVTLDHIGGAGVATIRGRRVPEVSLAEVLGLESIVAANEGSLIVLRPAGGDVYALAVDRIHDHEELVVKPAAPAVMATGLYAGTTLADDGSPILLFDPAGLAEVGGVKL